MRRSVSKAKKNRATTQPSSITPGYVTQDLIPYYRDTCTLVFAVAPFTKSTYKSINRLMYNENVPQIHSRSLFIQKENEIMKCMELENKLREVIQTYKDKCQ